MISNGRKAIVAAPSILGLKQTGVDKLPEKLLSLGLADRLSARLADCVNPPPYNSTRDPENGFLNSNAIARYSVNLADAISEVLDRNELPAVLGGDCSIILGCMLALRRRGQYGLFFMDGHADFYQPEANVNGEAASSDLALVTGRGPSVLTNFEGFCPLIHDENVVSFGFRDEAEQRQYDSQPLPDSIVKFDLAAIQRLGVRFAAEHAVDYLRRRGLDGVWLHLDADVLSDDIMPAVDYRLPDGLSWIDLETTLKTVYASGLLVGLDVTIYNPCLDADNRSADGLVKAISNGLDDD